MGILIAIFGVIGIGVVSIIASGFVLSVLWGWFIMPIFAVKAIGIAQAIGLAMAVNYVTYQNIKTEKQEIGELITYLLMRPVFALLIGWIITCFI